MTKKIVLAGCTFFCMVSELVLYYICSKQTILSSRYYGYYCAVILLLPFIVGMLCIRKEGRHAIKMNMLYAGTFLMSVLSVAYFFLLLYNIKIPRGVIELLGAFFMLTFLMSMYYIVSGKYKNDATYALQMFTFVCCGAIICVTMAQHHVLDTPETIISSKIRYICVIGYIVIMELLLMFKCLHSGKAADDMALK